MIYPVPWGTTTILDFLGAIQSLQLLDYGESECVQHYQFPAERHYYYAFAYASTGLGEVAKWGCIY